MPFFPSFGSPLHGISDSVTVLTSSSHKDGQAVCWDAGVGMVAGRLTNCAEHSPSTSRVHGPIHTTTVLVNGRSESKMQLRSQAVRSTSKFRRMYDTSSLSSRSSSQSSSSSEDSDPIFQGSPESTDAETSSVPPDGMASLSPSADCIHLSGKSFSTCSYQTDVSLSTSSSEHTIKNRYSSSSSSPSSLPDTISTPLLSRIRPCHVVLHKMDPMLLSVEHPPVPQRPIMAEQAVVESGVSASVSAGGDSSLRKRSYLKMDKPHTSPGSSDRGSRIDSPSESQKASPGKEADENHQVLQQIPTSVGNEQFLTPSCIVVDDNESYKDVVTLGGVVNSGCHSSRRIHTKVRSGSFNRHRPYLTRYGIKNHPVEDVTDEGVHLGEDHLEQEEEGCTKDQLVQQLQQLSDTEIHSKDPHDVNKELDDPLPLPNGGELSLGSAVKSTSDSEVDILALQEDCAPVHHSRRRKSHPRRVDVNLKMQLSEEEVLSPYEFELEQEVISECGSPSLLDHADPDISGVQEEHVGYTQVQCHSNWGKGVASNLCIYSLMRCVREILRSQLIYKQLHRWGDSFLD